MRIKTPVKRHYLDAFQSEGLFFLLYKWTAIWLCIVVVWEKTTDVFIIAVRGGGLSLESQSLPSFKEGVGNKFHTPFISHRSLFPITAIIKSERSQYFYFRNSFVLYIVFMRIKTPEKRRYLNVFQSEGLFFLLYKWNAIC